MNEVNPSAIAATVAWGGFVIAFVFGYVGNRSNFCTMGAVSDIVNMGDWSRMRMWLLAIAVAMIGTCALQVSGLIDVADSIYAGPRLLWVSHLLGGFLFGFGMVLGSGCGSKTLLRVGTGNLKSVVVMVFLAIGAYMTLRGLFAPFRVNVLEKAAIDMGGAQDLAAVLARGFSIERGAAHLGAVVVLAGALIAFAFRSREFRTAQYVTGGLVVGLVIVAGWYLTGVIGHLEEHPETLQEAFVGTNTGRMESLTFVAPQAFTLELLLFWSDKSRVVTFGIASVLGVIAGSLAYAITSKSFRLEGFREPEDLVNHMVAGMLMGFGGVTALGCTVGQGISGLSTLAVGSFITFGAIIAGAVAAMKYQYWRIERAALVHT
jgi:uncharacterized membrane protein YedE/YeeE